MSVALQAVAAPTRAATSRLPPGRTKKVIAVMPAFNAEKTLVATYRAIPRAYVDEVILVDDASTDRTVPVAAQLADVLVIVHQKNRGYGGNQKTCYTEALQRGADLVIMIHPDFQYDPTYVPHMLAPLLTQSADLVLGSRFLAGDPRRAGMDWWRYAGNRFLTAAQNLTLGTHLSEGHSGYRAYTQHLLATVAWHSFSDDFTFDSELLAAVARAGMRIAEVPIPTRYTSETSSASFLSSIRYGLGTLRTLL